MKYASVTGIYSQRAYAGEHTVVGSGLLHTRRSCLCGWRVSAWPTRAGRAAVSQAQHQHITEMAAVREQRQAEAGARAAALERQRAAAREALARYPGRRPAAHGRLDDGDELQAEMIQWPQRTRRRQAEREDPEAGS